MFRSFSILLILFLGLVVSLPGQSKSRSKENGAEKLEQARQMSEKRPEQAIVLVEEVVRESKKNRDQRLEAEAFLLLGEIYENIDQDKLALQRFFQSANLAKGLKDQLLLAKSNYRMGMVQTRLGAYKEAESNFTLCRNTSPDPDLVTRCNEGLADLAFAKKDYQQSEQLYDQVRQDKNIIADSVSISRIEAKKSQNYSNQQKYDKAEESLLNSLNSLPKRNIEPKEFEQIQTANQLLIEEDSAANNPIAMRLNTYNRIEKANIPEEALVKEQLQLADASVRGNDLVKAADHLKDAEALITPKVSPEARAKVFKLSSEVALKKGTYETAVNDYQKYVAANDEVLAEKQRELDQQIQILENQNKIDLFIKDYALEEKDRVLLESQIRNQWIVIGLLSLLLLAALGGFYFIMKNVQARRRANQLVLLKSLRTQMNPHFIFNALNSVNHYIAQSDERAANQFLSDFSRLMRMVLEYSNRDFIAFEEEMHLLDLYLKLEHLRFKDKFEYQIDRDPDLSDLAPEIPPMLIQPFVENAIWHGLRYKEEMGVLNISILKENGFIRILIEDNGIGRDRSKALKTKNQKQYKSTGLNNVSRRIELINEVYHKQYQLNISDLQPNAQDVGTRVELLVPIDKP
ncbi:MAG: hypothetical protein DHS20C18_46380 [Saprospiraceae bacterium]|nr:MAG: hypothetical protein DHS20C18_46380 [Saprospiraceae bacterium]